MIYAYPCELTTDEDGGLVATFPDVPEAITGGGDRAEALAMAEDALATARKLANPDHNSRIGQLHKALRVLGLSLTVEVTGR